MKYYSYYKNRPTQIFEPASKNPSMTVPGQTLSLKELLARYVRGENVEVFNAKSGDDSIPAGLENLDEIERIDMARSLKKSIKKQQSILSQSIDPSPEQLLQQQRATTVQANVESGTGGASSDD